ncbi:hypothetical protein [Streptosporangium roseum]|uniref:hypothetical protein n=1 Tax=Streptosporangium roseum TaxID=2001 RepID=UPI00331CBB37
MHRIVAAACEPTRRNAPSSVPRRTALPMAAAVSRRPSPLTHSAENGADTGIGTLLAPSGHASTDLVGHVLAKTPKGLNSKSTAALADQVLPALTAAMGLLKQQDPAEAGNFRRTVIVAIEAAARTHQGQPSPTLADMTREITAALDAA